MGVTRCEARTTITGYTRGDRCRSDRAAFQITLADGTRLIVCELHDELHAFYTERDGATAADRRIATGQTHTEVTT